jgi:hypothetical protein
MRVFISWSGQQSRQVALALREWLPQVLQQVDPFVSSEDIDKGARWNSEIAHQLDASEFGIICVTRENQHAVWLNFEAGALGKSVEQGRVACLLLDLPASDVTGPLDAFQHTAPALEDVIKLVKSVNKASSTPIRETVIETLVPKLWSDLAAELAKAAHPSVSGAANRTTRSQPDMLSELIELTREIHRQMKSPTSLGRSGGFGETDRRTRRMRELRLFLQQEMGDTVNVIQTNNGLAIRTPVPANEDVVNRATAFASKHNLGLLHWTNGTPFNLDDDPIEGNL